MKNIFVKIKGFIIKHKIISIIISIVLVAGITTTTVVLKRINKQPENNLFSYTRTVTLTKSSLEQTVSATGTVESQNTSTVTANSDLNYAVKTINVKVGDNVKEGDTIAILDTTELNKQISKQQETIAEQIKQAQKIYDNSVTYKDELWGERETAIAKLNTANTNLSIASSNYNTAKQSITFNQNQYDIKNAALQTATATLNTCKTNNPATYATACTVEQSAYDNAKAELTAAENQLNEAKNSSNFTNYENTYNSAVKSQAEAQTNYDNIDSKFKSANAAIVTNKENLEKASTNDTLEDLQTKLANCTIKATSSGTITSMNMTVGSKPNGTLATIQDLNKLKVTISIQEYDINNVEVGMPAIITSDATEVEMNGEVAQISPVASSQGMGSSSSTFSCEVNIKDADAGLLIGMNAKVVITTSSIDNVYTVPIDAVEDDNGTYYIYVQNGSDNYEKTQVTIGDSNDYYMEISGSNLKEGMIIRASAVEEEATEEINNENGINFFGGFGNNNDMPAPSGGGNMPSGGGGNMPPSGGNSMPSGGPNGN